MSSETSSLAWWWEMAWKHHQAAKSGNITKHRSIYTQNKQHLFSIKQCRKLVDGMRANTGRLRSCIPRIQRFRDVVSLYYYSGYTYRIGHHCFYSLYVAFALEYFFAKKHKIIQFCTEKNELDEEKVPSWCVFRKKKRNGKNGVREQT